MGRRSIEAIAEVRLFPIWRRAAPVHRKCLRADGSVADPGDGCAEISAAARGEPPGGTTRLYHTAAAVWGARHTGASPYKQRSRQSDGRAIRCRGLASSIFWRRRQAQERRDPFRIDPASAPRLLGPTLPGFALRAGWNRV